jgi:hypothetical protein
MGGGGHVGLQWACRSPTCCPNPCHCPLPLMICQRVGQTCSNPAVPAGGGGFRATRRWPSQATVAVAREAFVYGTRFHLESRAHVGSLSRGLGDPQANASSSENGRSRHCATTSVPTIKWIRHWKAAPMAGQSRNKGAHPTGMGMRPLKVVLISLRQSRVGGIARLWNRSSQLPLW